MTPRSRHRAFGVLKHMSKRELRALVGAEDPASPSLEPEAEGREGHAEAARLARVGAEVEEELERARESARSLKECFGKRVPSAAEAAGWRSSLCCLAASALSPTKCHWEPTQRIEHLGLIV